MTFYDYIEPLDWSQTTDDILSKTADDVRRAIDKRHRNLDDTMKTCGVNVIGHPDDGNYPVDYKKLANVAADMNVILEVNNASFIPTTYRINTESNCKEMLKWCKEYGTNVIISSDAHFETLVGRHDLAVKLLEDIEFPQELVLNSDPENFFAILKKRKKA